GENLARRLITANPPIRVHQQSTVTAPPTPKRSSGVACAREMLNNSQIITLAGATENFADQERKSFRRHSHILKNVRMSRHERTSERSSSFRQLLVIRA